MAKLINEVNKSLDDMKKEVQHLDRTAAKLERQILAEERRYKSVMSSLKQALENLKGAREHFKGRAHAYLKMKAKADNRSFEEVEQDFIKAAKGEQEEDLLDLPVEEPKIEPVEEKNEQEKPH